MQKKQFFKFTQQADISEWCIVDDVVMGGRSTGEFVLNNVGNGVFQGTVSLENNGGFSMVRRRFDQQEIVAYSKFVLRIKGDGKPYQFRVKTSPSDSYSYIGKLNTSGEWETIEIPFSTMYAAFRGRTLDIPNFPGAEMREIAFLIGNKKAEGFKLLIDFIALL